MKIMTDSILEMETAMLTLYPPYVYSLLLIDIKHYYTTLLVMDTM